MKDLQKKYLEIFEKNAGNISVSCRKCGIARQTHKNWCNSDAEFKQAIEDIEESLLDFSESKMFKAISEDNWNAIKFHLETKGKTRGYIIKTQHEQSGGLNITGVTFEVVHSRSSGDEPQG